MKILATIVVPERQPTLAQMWQRNCDEGHTANQEGRHKHARPRLTRGSGGQRRFWKEKSEKGARLQRRGFGSN